MASINEFIQGNGFDDVVIENEAGRFIIFSKDLKFNSGWPTVGDEDFCIKDGLCGRVIAEDRDYFGLFKQLIFSGMFIMSGSLIGVLDQSIARSVALKRIIEVLLYQ